MTTPAFRPAPVTRSARPLLIVDERGLSSVEYVVILVLLAAIGIAGWRLLGSRVQRALGGSAASLELLGKPESDEGAGVGPGATHELGAASPAAQAPPASLQPAVFVAPQVAGASVTVPPASFAAIVPATGAVTARAGPAGGRPESVTTPLSTAGSGLGTRADYAIGPAQHPNIQHDNGFLQNPKDPNDPVPQPTRSPTLEERKAYAKQVLKAEAGVLATQNHWPKGATPKAYQQYLDLPDGIEGYDHFLTGNGADHHFSYDKYVQDDAAGKTTLRNAIGDTQQGAEALYRDMLKKDPSLAGKPVSFEMKGSPIGVGNPFDATYPYPATENWQKAIGGHTIWNSATVTVAPSTVPGDPPKFSMDYTLHAEDRYNFNPGMKDIATGQPDSDNGRFEVSGLGHQYMNYSTIERDVSWQEGSAAGTTKTDPQGR